MGGWFSSPPWRPLPKNNKENLNFVRSYRPRNSNVKHLRILLNGPVGAGKSSFINSVDSVLQGRITTRAPADASLGSSYTLEYKTYTIKTSEGDDYKFVFNDIMGFEKLRGVCTEDVKLALRGHVKEGYEFKPGQPLQRNDEKYNQCPTLNDKIHVLICVIPTDKVSMVDKEVIGKLREIRLEARKIGIPQLVILTQVDESCDEVKRDIRNAYYSKYTKEQLKKFSIQLGVQENCFFLVKNYCSETTTNDNLDALILAALRQILTSGEDFLNDQ